MRPSWEKATAPLGTSGTCYQKIKCKNSSLWWYNIKFLPCFCYSWTVHNQADWYIWTYKYYCYDYYCWCSYY